MIVFISLGALIVISYIVEEYIDKKEYNKWKSEISIGTRLTVTKPIGHFSSHTFVIEIIDMDDRYAKVKYSDGSESEGLLYTLFDENWQIVEK